MAGSGKNGPRSRSVLSDYEGSTITPDVGWPAQTWVWIADTATHSATRFAPPGVLPTHDLRRRFEHVVAAPKVWGDLLDRTVESFRAEALELDIFDPLTEELVEEADGFEEAKSVDAHLASPEPDRPTGEVSSEVWVKILGPVVVEGWRSAPERAIVTELACYLALHRGHVISGEALRAALRPEVDREQSAKTMRTYLSALRRSLGPDALPTGSARGYRLSDAVRCDWQEFVALETRGRLEDLLEALALGRGRPFEGVPARTFGWVFSEFLISDIEVSVARVATEASRICRERGNLETALWALRRGLVAVGADHVLWEEYVSVAGAMGPATLERARLEARVALGEDLFETWGG